MLKIDCSELAGDLKLALAEAVSAGLAGSGIALLDGDYIVIDELSKPAVNMLKLRTVVQSYLASRTDASTFKVEEAGNSVVVHSTIPVTTKEKRVKDQLPPGLFQCPVCGYVSTSEDAYQLHLRMHDYVRGIS